MWEDIRVINNISVEDLSYIYEVYKYNKWDDLEILGKGASGKVYGYRDYAIKLLKNNEYFSRHKDIEIFEFLQGKVSCIPTLYAIISDTVMIMERIRGVTVYQYIYQNERDMKKVNQFVRPDFNDMYRQGLDEIVKAGYAPKDLHEENVMIDYTGKPVIVDVGLFKKLDEDEIHNYNIENDEDVVWSLKIICGGVASTYLKNIRTKQLA